MRGSRGSNGAAGRRMHPQRHGNDCLRRLHGFTLVELLVVIAIIAALIALLFPAVQAVRESARRAQCGNNVAQLAKAALAHETTQGYYPGGGWGSNWVGDADRGFGKTQPGGFMYSLLPYLEQQAVWVLPADGNPDSITTVQKDGARRMVRTVLPTANCPTRRPGQLLPTSSAGIATNASDNAANDFRVARSDYAINAGDGPTVDSGTTGIAHTVIVDQQGSEVRATDIIDGASLTYLVGERYINPTNYFTGLSAHDDRTWSQGSDDDTVRTGALQPAQDRAGNDVPGNGLAFGGPHAMSFCMSFADGAVKWIRFDIDPKVHISLADRTKNHPDMPVIPGNAIR